MLLVDELDRCRPTYAVQILEKMKHLFNVPNIFVLAVDRNQLGLFHSINVRTRDGCEWLFCDGSLILILISPSPQQTRSVKRSSFRFGLEAIFEKRTADLIKYDQRNLHTAFSAFLYRVRRHHSKNKSTALRY